MSLSLIVLANILQKFGMLPMKMSPFVDGTYLKRHPVESLREGDYADVDIMMGVTSNEGALDAICMCPQGL